MTAGQPEKRREKRVDTALPVILENATGVTRDMSASGVFFWKRGTFVYGESIRFSMERKTESGKFMQKCRGVVVRTEPRGSDVGVAARITESTTEPVPSHLSGTELLKFARERPRNITQRWDDALASAIETVDRWSSLLRNKALEEACEELQGQEVLKWDIPSIANATTPHSRRVTVCSVTVIGVGKQSKFVNWQNPHDGRIGRIELETYVANASQGDRKRSTAPLAKVVVRTTSVRDDDHHQELDENCYQQKSYSDPTEAFEAFLALAVERAIFINLDLNLVES